MKLYIVTRALNQLAMYLDPEESIKVKFKLTKDPIIRSVYEVTGPKEVLTPFQEQNTTCVVNKPKLYEQRTSKS